MKRGKKNRRVGTHRGTRALSNRSFRPLFLMIYFASITVLLHENNRTNYRRYSSFVRGTARESFDPILASIDKSSCVIFRGGATNNDSLRRERENGLALSSWTQIERRSFPSNTATFCFLLDVGPPPFREINALSSNRL